MPAQWSRYGHPGSTNFYTDALSREEFVEVNWEKIRTATRRGTTTRGAGAPLTGARSGAVSL